jgi:prepilin-type N-terminal cleavage/methylation domain-containing protein
LNKTFPPYRDQRAFTLIELILVLAMMGLIAGLTTPFLLATLERIKGQSSVRELVSSFRYARSQAITQKIPFEFHVSIDDNQYWLRNPETNEISEIGKLDPGIAITRFSDEEQDVYKGSFFIVFFPQGSASGGSIFIESTVKSERKSRYAIYLDTVTGKPHVEQPA